MYQVDLVCDSQFEPVDYTGLEPFCLSKRRANPHAELDSKTDMKSAVSWIESNAKKHGWVKHHGKWACPNCKTLLKKSLN